MAYIDRTVKNPEQAMRPKIDYSKDSQVVVGNISKIDEFNKKLRATLKEVDNKTKMLAQLGDMKLNEKGDIAQLIMIGEPQHEAVKDSPIIKPKI